MSIRPMAFVSDRAALLARDLSLTEAEASFLPAIMEAEACAALCGVDHVASRIVSNKAYRDYVAMACWRMAQRQAKGGAS